jgi:hypothetical protein
MNTAIVAALILVVAGAATAQARVNFNVNIDVPAGVLPLPPVAAYPTQPVAVPVGYPGVQQQVVVEEPPRFIYSPNLGFYVSVGTPEDIVYYNQGYYIYRDGYWYLSPSYRGPWSVVSYRRLPLGLRTHRYRQIRHFRDHEYRSYMRDRDHYRGTWYRPAAGTVIERRDDRGGNRWDERRGDRWDGRR